MTQGMQVQIVWVGVWFDRWQDHAKCIDTDPTLFYPGQGSNGQVSTAKRFCKGQDGTAVCPVLDECLDHAMAHDERFGVWGGTSERERRKLRKTWPRRSL